jgi:hypothetical protein
MNKWILIFMFLLLMGVVSADDTALYCPAGVIELAEGEFWKVEDSLFHDSEFSGCYLEVDYPTDNFIILGSGGNTDVEIDKDGYLKLIYLSSTENDILFDYELFLNEGTEIYLYDDQFDIYGTSGRNIFMSTFYFDAFNSFSYDLEDDILHFSEADFEVFSDISVFLGDYYFSLPETSKVFYSEDLMTLKLNDKFECNEDLKKDLDFSFVAFSNFYTFHFSGCSGYFSLSSILESEDDSRTTINEENKKLVLELGTDYMGEFDFIDKFGSYNFKLSPANYLIFDLFSYSDKISGEISFYDDDLDKGHINFCDYVFNQGDAFLGTIDDGNYVIFDIDEGDCYPTSCGFSPYDDSDYILSCGSDYPKFVFSNHFENPLSYFDGVWQSETADGFGVKDNLINNFGEIRFFEDYSDSTFKLYLDDRVYLEDIVGFRTLEAESDGYLLNCDSFVFNDVRFSAFSTAFITTNGEVVLDYGGVIHDLNRDLGYFLERNQQFTVFVNDGVDMINSCDSYYYSSLPDTVFKGCIVKKLANNEVYSSEVYVVSKDNECNFNFLGSEGLTSDQGPVVSEEDDFSEITEKYFPYSNHPKSVGAPSDYALMQAIKYVGKYDEHEDMPTCCGDYVSMLYKSLGYNYIYNQIGKKDETTKEWTGSDYSNLEDLANDFGGPPLGYSHNQNDAGHALLLLGFDSEAQWWVEQIGDIAHNYKTTNVKDGQALTISFTGGNTDKMRFDVFPKSGTYPKPYLNYVYEWKPLCNYNYLACPADGVDKSWSLKSYECDAGEEYVWLENQAGDGDGLPWSRFWEPNFSPYYPHKGVC